MISLSFTLDDRRYILGATGLAHILDTGVARDVTNPYPVLLEYVHELLERRPEQPTADLEAQNMAVEIHTSEDFMGAVARRVREAEARPSLTEECPGARISRLEASQAEQKWRVDGLEEDANSLWHRIDKHRQMIDKLMARGEATENRLAQLWAVKEEGP